MWEEAVGGRARETVMYGIDVEAKSVCCLCSHAHKHRYQCLASRSTPRHCQPKKPTSANVLQSLIMAGLTKAWQRLRPFWGPLHPTSTPGLDPQAVLVQLRITLCAPIARIALAHWSCGTALKQVAGLSQVCWQGTQGLEGLTGYMAVKACILRPLLPNRQQLRGAL